MYVGHGTISQDVNCRILFVQIDNLIYIN